MPGTPTSDEVNRRVAQILTTRITTIDEVIGVMERIDGALPKGDGLKWFNLLYLKVTQAVLNQHQKGEGWWDLDWLGRLDVVFAGLYFDAVSGWIANSGTTARSWKPLLASRSQPCIDRLQFALSGMNAHINRDLMLAVVQTCKEQRKTPRRGSPQHQDYVRVNALLEAVMPQVKVFLATGIVGEIDQGLGDEDDLIAMWSVRKARETAWANAEVLWRLRRIPMFYNELSQNIDRLGELVSRGLLSPARY